MDRLPHNPRNLREIVEADLRRAARLAIKIQDEIDPQFRIATPEGDFWLGVTLPATPYERAAMMRRVSLFMAWKLAASFTLATELIEPDCIVCAGVSHGEVVACATTMKRTPRPWTKANFSSVEWLPASSVGDDVRGMLPRGQTTVTAKELDVLEKWFGANGQFPAVHIASGEVGV